MSRTVLVCQHETCPLQGADAVLQALKSQAPADVIVQGSGCLGQCGSGPMVLVLPEKIWYCQVNVKDIPIIVEQHLKRGKPYQRKLYPKFHPPQKSFKIWLIVLGVSLGLLSLLFYLIASQTYYF